MSSSLKLHEQFSSDFTWGLLWKGIDNLFEWFHTIEQDGHFNNIC